MFGNRFALGQPCTRAGITHSSRGIGANDWVELGHHLTLEFESADENWGFDGFAMKTQQGGIVAATGSPYNPPSIRLKRRRFEPEPEKHLDRVTPLIWAVGALAAQSKLPHDSATIQTGYPAHRNSTGPLRRGAPAIEIMTPAAL